MDLFQRNTVVATTQNGIQVFIEISVVQTLDGPLDGLYTGFVYCHCPEKWKQLLAAGCTNTNSSCHSLPCRMTGNLTRKCRRKKCSRALTGVGPLAQSTGLFIVNMANILVRKHYSWMIQEKLRIMCHSSDGFDWNRNDLLKRRPAGHFHRFHTASSGNCKTTADRQRWRFRNSV